MLVFFCGRLCCTDGAAGAVVAVGQIWPDGAFRGGAVWGMMGLVPPPTLASTSVAELMSLMMTMMRKLMAVLCAAVRGGGLAVGGRGGVAVVLGVLAWPVRADWEVNLPRGVSAISREVYDMHMMVLYICAGIGVVVFGAMFISILKHRKSLGVTPATFSHSTTAEIIWSVIPFFILVGMAIPAARALIKMEDTSNADLTIEVTGHQWKWEYGYPEHGIRFFSNLGEKSREARVLNSGIDPRSVPNYLLEVDKRLVLPVGRKVRILLTANDVLHAWWVPAFAIKKDAVPGFVNEMWTRIDEPGIYRGQCAELCGRDHGFMPIVVEAVSEGEFERWVEGEKAAALAEANSADREWSMAELRARGEEVYGVSCVACHQANGQGVAGVFPALAGTKLGLAEHLEVVMHGKAGTAMQAFGAQLSDVDIAAVVTFERNAWGDERGEVVQPVEVRGLR